MRPCNSFPSTWSSPLAHPCGVTTVRPGSAEPSPRRGTRTIQVVRQGGSDVSGSNAKGRSPSPPGDVTTLLQQQEHALREEFNRVSKELVCDLEARLTVQIEFAKSTALRALSESNKVLRKECEADWPQCASRGDVIVQTLHDDAKPKSGGRMKDFEPRTPDTQEFRSQAKQCMKDGTKSNSGINSNKIHDIPLEVLENISDHVIKRVNADPRFCKVVENHQSLQESFTKLMDIMERASPPTETTQTNRQTEKHGELHDMMVDVHKCCQSVALQVRQLRQRRNQDISETTLRFEAWERRQKVIDALLADGRNGKYTEAFEAKGIEEESHSLHQMEDNTFEDETDAQ